MNIEEYISSGILEAYVLNELSTPERVEVEQNLELYPELKEELGRVEKTAEKFVMKAAVQPRAHVKGKILTAIENSGEPKIIPMTPPVWRYATAASIATPGLWNQRVK